MRTIKITILSLLCIVTCNLMGQTQQKPNCYKGKTVVHGKGVSYNVEDNNTMYELINTKNIIMGKPLLFKDGTPVPEEDYIMYMPNEVDDNQLYRAFRETFESWRINSFKSNNEEIMIYYVFDSLGNTIEVGFLLNNTPIMCSISIDQLYLLERNIKKYVKYQPTENTKKIQFSSVLRNLHLRKL